MSHFPPKKIMFLNYYIFTPVSFLIGNYGSSGTFQAFISSLILERMDIVLG